ncbi:MAG: undecaprenyl-phosphate glucose phosphotransferase [Paludibacter sp.]|jgi:putative colanic acid biosynthesis UDP-glucose lipid carrier transferase|nr:undecaprenyl-phosphate glucose phosphotransferase [Paludibacter sp.]
MKSNETELRFLYLAFDLVILNIAFAIVYSMSSLLKDLNTHDKSLYLLLLNMSAVITYSVFSTRNLYLHDDFSNRVKRITNRMLIFSSVVFAFAHFFLPEGFSLFFLFQCALLFYVGKLFFYYALYAYLKFSRSKGIYVHRVLIIGMNDMSGLLRKLLDNNPMLGYEFIGYVSDKKEADENVLGELHELAHLVSHHQIDFLFVTLSAYNDLKKSKELLALCNRIGVRLRFVPENQYWFKPRMNMESVGSLVVFNPQEIPLDDINSRFFKRAFDVIFSSMVILFVISWLFPLLCVLIKLTSKGPVFFKQKRTGINNRTFTCMKFRTMRMSSDADEKQATKNDSRVTPLGAFLRKSNLDEFPQFFNVFVGQMSIVGPRPHMLKHTNQYSELIDYYRVRHYVKPGITGWAQVSGYRGETDELWKMQKRVEYDMSYLEGWTFWWDLKIVVLTVFGKNSHKNAF